jgi:hypothetical protein
MAGGWQPIETAPRDGTLIDLWGSCKDSVGRWEGRFPNCHWGKVSDRCGGHFTWMDDEDWGMDSEAYGAIITHWMPLPEPPEAA